MRPKDVVIWDQFIHNNPDTFLRVWYDVHIGDPVGKNTDHKEMHASGMYDVSCWCVDVVAEASNNFWIIEIKPDALAGALGQALAYTALLEKQNLFHKPIVPVVLTDSISPITLEAAGLLKVGLLTP